jgi:hypothetical protein
VEDLLGREIAAVYEAIAGEGKTKLTSNPVPKECRFDSYRQHHHSLSNFKGTEGAS